VARFIGSPYLVLAQDVIEGYAQVRCRACDLSPTDGRSDAVA
jgi:hypothetical protein